MKAPLSLRSKSIKVSPSFTASGRFVQSLTLPSCVDIQILAFTQGWSSRVLKKMFIFVFRFGSFMKVQLGRVREVYIYSTLCYT